MVKALAKVGSIPFIQKTLPLLDTPTLIMGISSTNNSSSIVCSINKELFQFYSTYK